MIRYAHKIKKNLSQEVNRLHVFVIVVFPIILFIIFFIYTKALSTEFMTDRDVHTRIVYYDGGFSQDLAIDTIDTSTYIVNQSDENIKALVYEYNTPDTNKNTINVVNVPKFTDKLLTTTMPSMVVISNERQVSTSTILVGENKRIDNDRLAFLEAAIYSQINNKNINSIKYAFQNLKKIHKVDKNVERNCVNIVTKIAEIANSNFGNLKAATVKDDFCGNAYARTIKSLEPQAVNKEVKIIRYGRMLEITLPNE